VTAAVSTSAVLGQALAYAGAGWPVFPCKPGSKEPDTAHGFKDATTDPAVIRAWWRGRADRNVAIATGAPGPDVLDVDVKPDGDGFAAFNRLKRAGLLTGARALVRTPSGGLHAYYAGSGQPSGRLVRHFLDFKAAGGYVLAPPSEVAGRPYELLDQRAETAGLDWQAVRRLLDPPSAAPALPPRGTSGTGALVAFVAGLTEGNRNNGLFWAACRMTEAGNTADLDQLVAASTLPEAEARRTVASAARKAER
jgi:Bifunctional DNA primase/polymerase, N-terminal